MKNVTETELFDKVSYDVCSTCGGLWLDRGELDKVASQTPGSVEQSTLFNLREMEARNLDNPMLRERLSLIRECLRDGQRMVKMQFMGDAPIVMDYCKTCGGLWLDKGELSEINRYIKWFDKKAAPSRFDRFLRHMHGSFWHRIKVED
jgi:Zn-finger nucleic acid-binding protein